MHTRRRWQPFKTSLVYTSLQSEHTLYAAGSILNQSIEMFEYGGFCV